RQRGAGREFARGGRAEKNRHVVASVRHACSPGASQRRPASIRAASVSSQTAGKWLRQLAAAAASARPAATRASRPPSRPSASIAVAGSPAPLGLITAGRRGTAQETGDPPGVLTRAGRAPSVTKRDGPDAEEDEEDEEDGEGWTGASEGARRESARYS